MPPDGEIDSIPEEDWAGPYGIKQNSNRALGFDAESSDTAQQGPYSVNVGSWSYLMEDDNEYKLFRMLENGISYDVDMSNMPCGINSAIYFFVTQGPYSVNVGSCSSSWRTTTSTSCSA